MKPRNWAKDGYWDQTRVVNKIYADKHNYRYMSYKSDAKWNEIKVIVTNQFLASNPDVDWVLFMDSDAYVSLQELNLTIIKHYFNVTADVHNHADWIPICRRQ